MIANSILCHGNSRFLQKVYMTDVDVTGTTSFASVSAGTITATTSLVSSGTLSVTGASTLTGAVTARSTISATGNITSSANLYATGGYLYLAGKYAIDGGKTTANWVTINNGQFSGGTEIKGILKSATANITTANITTGTVNTLKSTNIEATNSITSPKWEIDSIANLGGTFMVAPTIYFSSTATVATGTITATTMPITITDTSSNSPFNGVTSEHKLAGTTWFQGAKVKFSGTINGVGFSSAEGVVSAQMTTSNKKIQLTITTSKAYNVLASNTNYTGAQIENIVVMQYQTPTSNNGSPLYPLGIYMSSFGDNRKSFIDIYGGTAAEGNPNVRIGLLNGLPNLPNGTTPTSWGIYTDNGFFKGTIYSQSGKIGGWDIGTNILKNGNLGVDGSVWLLTADRANADAKAIGGSSSELTTWRITAGDSFGVTKNGDLYCNQAHISGEITATSGTIGGCSIANGVLKIAEANITGTLSSSVIDASSLTIGQSQVTNLTTDLGNKASTTSVTTLSNKVSAVYGTSSTTATTQEKAVICSNFEYFAGALITVKFSTANTYATAKITMNVNSKGAKDVWVANAVTSSTNQLLWGANAVITFRYDGTQFVVVGEPRNWYGASTTAAATAAKTDTTAATGCVVCKGTVVSLSMTNNNTATSPTLNINGTGAKNLYAGNGTTRPLASNGLSWTAGSTASFIFDGQYWRVGETAGLASAYAANTAATNAAKTASNYISTITGGGIKVSYTTNPTSYTQITADGTSIYQNSSQVANFGSTATIGPSSGEHVYIDSDSVDIMNGNTVLASFGSNSVVNNILATSGSIGGFTIGTNTLEKRDMISGTDSFFYSTGFGNKTLTIDGTTQSIRMWAGWIENDPSLLPPDSAGEEYSTDEELNPFYVTNKGVLHATGGSILGNTEAGHVTINNNKFDMSYGNSSILKFSYGLGNAASGTAYAPYYTLGTRTTNSDVGNYSCVFGYSNTASGYCSTAEGFNNVVTNMYSHVEGNANTVSGGFSHCEGSLNTVSNSNAHAEGSGNTASGIYSHVEGNETTASANSAHAEGYKSVASGKAAHAEGNSQATGQYSHAEGSSMAIGAYSHAQGNGTIVSSPYNTVIGKYNEMTRTGSGTDADPYVYDAGDYAFIIGKGQTSSARSNALTVDWNGNLWVSGNLTAANIGTILTATGTSPTTISAWTWTTLCSLSLTAGTYMIYGYVHDGPPNVNTLLRLITFENDTQTQRQVSLTGNVSFGANGSVAGICSTTQTRTIQLLVDNATAISNTSSPYRGEIIAVRIK